MSQSISSTVESIPRHESYIRPQSPCSPPALTALPALGVSLIREAAAVRKMGRLPVRGSTLALQLHSPLGHRPGTQHRGVTKG